MSDLPLQLPAPLAPWAPFLELLPVESALALGPMLRRLDGFVGPLRALPLAGSVEPDGFDGLARRGLAERLLLSEWLLLDEAPMEFLRRFSGGESAYLQLARRDPVAARASLALFDCGPSCLGGPRLVQLAALLVLARRAQTAGASFRWGVWQKPGEWREAVNREAVEWWLSLRTEGEPSRRERAAWEEIWLEQNADFGRDELWLVGSNVLKELAPPRARCLEIRDEFDPFAPNRAVEIELDGRALRLETPDDAIGTRLLRDPFAHSAPKSADKNSFVVPPLDAGLVWAQSGWKLFARSREGDLLVFSVPNSPSATVGGPKTFAIAHNLVAVGRVGRATVAAALWHEDNFENTSLTFESWGRGSTGWDQTNFAFPAPLSQSGCAALTDAPLGQVAGVGNNAALAVLLSNGRFAVAEANESLRDENPEILGMALWNGAVTVLEAGRERRNGEFSSPRFRVLFQANGALNWRDETDEIGDEMPPDARSAHFGGGAQTNSSLWALEVSDTHWQLRTPGQRTTIALDSARQVVGALFDGGQPGLLLHAAGERELWLRGGAEERRLFRFWSPIASVAACPFAPLVAVQSDDELGVWSIPHGAWLLRARAA